MADSLVNLPGVALGGVIAALGAFVVAWYVERRRRKDERERERRVLLQQYLGRLAVVVSFISQVPETPPETVLQKARAETIGKLRIVRIYDWMTTQRKIHSVLGPNVYQPMHALVEAYAALQLVELAPAVRASVEQSMSYVARLSEDRSTAVLEEWPGIMRTLRSAIASSGDVGVLSILASDEGEDPST